MAEGTMVLKTSLLWILGLLASYYHISGKKGQQWPAQGGHEIAMYHLCFYPNASFHLFLPSLLPFLSSSFLFVYIHIHVLCMSVSSELKHSP